MPALRRTEGCSRRAHWPRGRRRGVAVRLGLHGRHAGRSCCKAAGSVSSGIRSADHQTRSTRGRAARAKPAAPRLVEGSTLQRVAQRIGPPRLMSVGQRCRSWRGRAPGNAWSLDKPDCERTAKPDRGEGPPPPAVIAAIAGPRRIDRASLLQLLRGGCCSVIGHCSPPRADSVNNDRRDERRLGPK